MAGEVRVGVGGWTFAPWRANFYPEGLKQKEELSYASRALTAIEINGTYYSSFSPKHFARWAAETPEGFIFTLKASRFCTNRKALTDAAPSIERFLAQGLGELGDRLGPILWQFMPTKMFERDDFTRFLDLLPARLHGQPLRHAVEVRHKSFLDSTFVELCRERGVAICAADHETFPMIADLTAPFAYARLMRGQDDIETCYPMDEITTWARRLETWSGGGEPEDLPKVGSPEGSRMSEREVFAFFISGGKSRAPAGAQALIAALRA